jgi:hypothetical protein
MLIHVKQRADIAHAQMKIDIFSSKGYQLIGSLSEIRAIWNSMKMGLFLFKKEERYYQCKSTFLFLEHTPEEIEACFNEQQEPLPKQPFSRILTSSYIFIMLKNGLFLLREDAHKSGHAFLAGPNAEEDIVGGELYFEKGNLLLANNKSGNYPTSEEEALPALIKVWGLSINEMFCHVIEKEQVELELARRKVVDKALESKDVPRLSTSSATFFANQPARVPIPQPPTEQRCLPCTIL